MDRAHRIGQKKKVYVYRLISQDTIEEKIVERAAIKLKLDQVIIQQGHQIKNTSLSKEDYESMVMHGATSIMAQKNSKIEAEDVSIDKLIEDGEKAHMKLKSEAEASIVKASEDKAFDFELKACKVFHFQDKDFKEEKKKIDEIIRQEQLENAEKIRKINDDSNKKSTRNRR